MDLRWEILTPYAPLFVTGAWMTVKLTLIALSLGLLLGLGIGLVNARPASGLRRMLRWSLLGYGG